MSYAWWFRLFLNRLWPELYPNLHFISIGVPGLEWNENWG